MSVRYGILLPCFDEEAGLAEVLERLAAFAVTQPDLSEIVVVDDGSTDGTAAIAAAAAERHPGRIRVERRPTNGGLVEGIRSGAAVVRDPVIVVLDADLSYAPEIVPPLVDALVRQRAGLALASPYLRGGRVSNVPLDRLIASRGANAILSACTLGRIKTFTGMVRAYRTETLKTYLAREPVGEFNSWLVAEAMRDGVRIVEVPAHLAWPPERRRSAPRISTQKLIVRALAVVRTALVLCRLSMRGKHIEAKL